MVTDNPIERTTNSPISSDNCRQCHTVLPFYAEFCPLCGLQYPKISDLTPHERYLVRNNLVVPPESHEISTTVSIEKTPLENFFICLGKRVNDYDANLGLIIAFLMVFIGGLMMLNGWGFPINFIIFWPALAYLAYDFITLFSSVIEAQTYKRLTNSKAFAPYPVLHKIEIQIKNLLDSIKSIVSSIFERDWNSSSAEFKSSSDSFITAAEVVTTRLKKYAELSVEIFSIIWRNNVYSIVASNQPLKEKISALGVKCREAEAMLLRYLWLTKFSSLVEILKEYISNPQKNEKESSGFYSKIIEEYHLSIFGPSEEPAKYTFTQTPYEISFLGRTYWHSRLPPFPLESPKEFSDFLPSAELFNDLQKVRKLKLHLEEQVALNLVAKTISTVSPLEEGVSPAFEAKQLTKDFVFDQYLDIPSFKPDPNALHEATDRLIAEVRVAMDTENIFDN